MGWVALIGLLARRTADFLTPPFLMLFSSLILSPLPSLCPLPRFALLQERRRDGWLSWEPSPPLLTHPSHR